jgi:large subunit ribosomal protein L35
MPKRKSHSGAKKRLSKTATGKFKGKKVGGRHLATGKGGRRLRRIKSNGYVHETMSHRVERMLPYA